MQEILFGENALSRLKALLHENALSKVFIVCGKHSVTGGVIDHIKSIVAPYQATIIEKNGADVTSEEIENGTKVFREKIFDVIISIGGGSVIDLAKGILFTSGRIGTTNRVTFIAIPTTAGSGTEATSSAVYYNNKEKKTFQHPAIQPGIVLLDHWLTYTLSPQQTAISGVDAFAQAVESMWNVHATNTSLEYARASLTISNKYLYEAVESPSPENRKQMLWAAHLAGKAIEITRTTGAHALSYYLTAHHNIPHGQAVGLFLPMMFVYNDPGLIKDERIVDRIGMLYKIIGVNDSQSAFFFTRALIEKLGLISTLKKIGIDKEKIFGDLIGSVNQERFNNNPVLFDRSRLLSLGKEYL